MTQNKERYRCPTTNSVKALRQQVQRDHDLGITAAQDICADLMHTGRRTWQQWEHGDRKMHPAFWELAQIKIPAYRP